MLSSPPRGLCDAAPLLRRRLRREQCSSDREVKQHSKTHLTTAARWVWQRGLNISVRGAQRLGAGAGNGLAD
jgi:hypothetical protein